MGAVAEFIAPLPARVTQRARSVWMSRSNGSASVKTTITPHLAAELLVEGETWPVFIWTIDHPEGRCWSTPA
jgi:hypothetical protein